MNLIDSLSLMEGNSKYVNIPSVKSYIMSPKTRIELQCSCNTCKLSFTIWNIEKLVGKEIGSGVFISEFICPNCQQKPLIFDLIREKDYD